MAIGRDIQIKNFLFLINKNKKEKPITHINVRDFKVYEGMNEIIVSNDIMGAQAIYPFDAYHYLFYRLNEDEIVISIERDGVIVWRNKRVSSKVL